MSSTRSLQSTMNPPTTIPSKPTCTPSRYTLPCGVCAASIAPGDLMFPIAINSSIQKGGSGRDREMLVGHIEKEKKRTGLLWAHKECGDFFGRSGTPTPPPCRHWVRLGRCPVREAGMCAFHHDKEVMEYRSLSAADKVLLSGPGTSRKKKWGGRRAVVRNDHKNSVFRAFLMQTYGLDFLRFGVNGDETMGSPQRSVILDIAGGLGKLSWELINLMGIESVVIDPRGPLALHSMDRKWRQGMYEPRRTGPVFRKWCPDVEDGSSQNRDPKHPLHIRCIFNAEAFVRLTTIGDHSHISSSCRYEDSVGKLGMEGEGEILNAEDWLRKEQARAKAVKWTTKGLTHDDDEDEDRLDYLEEHNPNCIDRKESQNTQEDCSTDPILSKDDPIEIIRARVVGDLLRRCSLVVGLHPDQAVGDIVAFADQLGLPWCVVPCCVYSKLFTKRRLKDGSDVRTYEQIVQWLCDTYPTAKVDTLGFEGKNKVVYTLPTEADINL